MSVEEEFIEELRESSRKRGKIHSVIRTQYGIAGGETRRKADPNWPEKFVQVKSYYDHLALKALDNLHHPKPPEWWENLVNEAAKWLVENEKIPPGKVAERLERDFPLSKRTLYKYLRPEYKLQEMADIRKTGKEEKGEALKDLRGRPRALTEAELEKAKELRSEGKSLREIASEIGVSKDTLSRTFKEMVEKESAPKLSQNLEESCSGHMAKDIMLKAPSAEKVEEKKAVAYIVDVTEQKHLQKELKNSVSKLERYSQQIIKTLSSIIEHKDPYTANHQRRVAELSKRIAQEMGFSKEKINAIYIGALLHDIGKIAIPTEILNKPGKLTPIEFEIVKTHPFKGYDILKNIDFPPEVLDIVYHHHERLDGTGYPDGLKNGDISLEVGIISVSDVVDAMSSHRPYRPPLGIDTALSEIEKWKGIKYYEEVVDICIRLFREKGFNLS